MKLLVDTNILIDFLDNRDNQLEKTRKIIELGRLNMLETHVYALTIPNILYILRKKMPRLKDIEDVIHSIMGMFKVEDLKVPDFQAALDLGFGDYEDALQAVCALRIGADYIITRNVKDFKNSPVPAITPEEFLRDIAFTN